MSQTDNNHDLNNGLTKFAEGLTMLVKGLDKVVENAKNDMTPEDALKFAEQLNKAGIDDQVKSAQSHLSDLKKQFNL